MLVHRLLNGEDSTQMISLIINDFQNGFNLFTPYISAFRQIASLVGGECY